MPDGCRSRGEQPYGLCTVHGLRRITGALEMGYRNRDTALYGVIVANRGVSPAMRVASTSSCRLDTSSCR